MFLRSAMRPGQQSSGRPVSWMRVRLARWSRTIRTTSISLAASSIAARRRTCRPVSIARSSMSRAILRTVLDDDGRRHDLGRIERQSQRLLDQGLLELARGSRLVAEDAVEMQAFRRDSLAHLVCVPGMNDAMASGALVLADEL